MKYYIELSDSQQRFRLQKDKTWKPITSQELTENDFLTDKQNEILAFQQINSINLEGKKWRINPEMYSLSDDDILSFKIFTVIDSIPNIPSKEQLREVILNGNDDINNSLILNADGIFELKEFETAQHAYKNYIIPVRYETFAAGFDNVGFDAANSDEHINQIYQYCMHYWVSYLKSGTLGWYGDLGEYRKIGDLINEIKELENQYL